MEKIARRWRLSNDETDRARWLIEHFGRLDEPEKMAWSALQPLLIAPGVGELLDWMASASEGQGRAAAFCREKLLLPPEDLNPPPLLTGDDLIALGIPQGPQYKILLGDLRAAQLDGLVASRSEAIAFVQKRV